jgi:hypothetical protein
MTFRKIPRDVHEDARDATRALMGTPEFVRRANLCGEVRAITVEAGEDVGAPGAASRCTTRGDRALNMNVPDRGRQVLAPVAAGLLVTMTGYSIFDPLIAAGIAVWIIVSTVREVFASSEELIWPEKIVCGHSDHEENPILAAPSRP